MTDSSETSSSGLQGGPAEPEYVLERSAQEYERLTRQARFVGETTDRLLRAAGLGPGMRVLDVGSGAGDVALMVAQMVGPTGEVVGVDVDAAALEVARGRARSSGLDNVTFVEGDVRTADADVGEGFDAAVARLVLMYWADPAAALQRIVARVRPAGVVVCQELDLDPSAVARSLPEQTLWSETGGLVVDTFVRAGMQGRMGRHLFRVFTAAGLPVPTMRDEALVGGGPDFGGYSWLAGVARSLAPAMTSLGTADVELLGLDTLAERIRNDAVVKDAVVWTPSLVGAFARRSDPRSDPGRLSS